MEGMRGEEAEEGTKGEEKQKGKGYVTGGKKKITRERVRVRGRRQAGK